MDENRQNLSKNGKLKVGNFIASAKKPERSSDAPMNWPSCADGLGGRSCPNETVVDEVGTGKKNPVQIGGRTGVVFGDSAVQQKYAICAPKPSTKKEDYNKLSLKS